MKYEFHVGDYVILDNGQEKCTGYVKQYKGPVFSNDYCFVFQWDDGTQFGWSGRIEELPHNFVRIGQYDFTKKDEGMVEPLSDNYTKSFPIFKTQDSVTGKTYKQECYTIDIGVISKKINELVEAVNRLEEKVNNQG